MRRCLCLAISNVFAPVHAVNKVAKPLKRDFMAKRAEFDAVRRHVENACAAIDFEMRQRIILIVEELFCNTIEHGYGGDCEQLVQLTVSVDAHTCHLIYEDCAPPHDPFTAIADLRPADTSTDQRRVGGLGVFLLAQFSSSHRYERRGNRNVIELQVPCAGDATG